MANVTIDMHQHHETEAAVLVSLDGERSTAIWLPKAAIEIEPRGTYMEVTMPERLAIDKGLI